MADSASFESEESSPAVPGMTAAAILLMLLDEEQAADILRGFDPDEVKQLGKAMFDASTSSEREIEDALSQFIERSRTVARLSMDVEPKIRGVISQAVGNVRANNILSDIAPQSSNAAIDLLRWMEPDTICKILADEHPQVGALIVAVLNADVAAKVLETLDEEVQAELLYRAARLTSVNADAIGDLEALLQRYADREISGAGMQLGGKSEIAKIVNSMPKSHGVKVIKTVKKKDKVLGQQIEDEMFVFEDLISLDSKSLGMVLRAVDSQVLTLALKGASPELADRAFAAMSARAAESIKDEMADMGPTKRTDVDAAQKVVIQIVRQLADEGTLMLGGRGDDYV